MSKTNQPEPVSTDMEEQAKKEKTEKTPETADQLQTTTGGAAVTGGAGSPTIKNN